MKTVKNVSNHTVPIIVGGRVKTVSEPGQKIDLSDDVAAFNVFESKGDIEICGKKKKEEDEKKRQKLKEKIKVKSLGGLKKRNR